MEQIFPFAGLNDEHHLSQAQIASSTFPATESDVQTSLRSEVFTLLKTGQSKILTSQSPGARVVALPVIDEELDRTRRLAHSLRSLRNTLTPISVLPAELLSLIFHFRAREDPPWPRRGKDGDPGWFAVTHVCQGWRQVALNDSSLWARLMGDSPSVSQLWISEVLVRARNAPLSIDFMNGLSAESFSKLRSHIFHIRELRLGYLWRCHRHVHVLDFFSSEAPILEHFELTGLDGCPANCLPPGTKLFDGRAPNLQTLTLTRVSIPWSLIPFCQLTQLKITVRSPDDLNLNHFLDLLINNPGLEVLILEFCLPSEFMRSQVSDGKPVHLPRLSRLCLSGSTSGVADLFKRLTLPSSATLHLRCNCEKSSAHLILPLVSTHLNNHVPAEIKTFRIVAANYAMSLATSIPTPKSTTYDKHVIENHMNSEANLILTFDRTPHPSTRADLLRQACSILPISNIEVLSIFFDGNVQLVDWYELFQRCKKVTTIEAKARGTISLLQGLAPPTRKGSKPTNMVSESKTKQGRRNDTAARSWGVNNVAAAHVITAPFPELTTLLLDSLNFDFCYLSGSGVLYDVIVDVLRRRKAKKNQLKTLHVNGCVITAERANSLKKYVQEVHWDKDEGEGYFAPWER